MSNPKIRTASYADIEALPPHVVGEILFGVLHTHPRPGPRHSVAANVLGTEVTGVAAQLLSPSTQRVLIAPTSSPLARVTDITQIAPSLSFSRWYPSPLPPMFHLVGETRTPGGFQ